MCAVEIRAKDLCGGVERYAIAEKMCLGQPLRNPLRLTAPWERRTATVKAQEILDLPHLPSAGYGQVPGQSSVDEFRRYIKESLPRQDLTCRATVLRYCQPTTCLPDRAHETAEQVGFGFRPVAAHRHDFFRSELPNGIARQKQRPGPLIHGDRTPRFADTERVDITSGKRIRH